MYGESFLWDWGGVIWGVGVRLAPALISSAESLLAAAICVTVEVGVGVDVGPELLLSEPPIAKLVGVGVGVAVGTGVDVGIGVFVG